MSVIFNSGVEAASRTTNLVSGSSNYTCCFYVKMSAAGSGYRTPWMIADSLAAPTQYVAFFTDTAGLTLKLWGDNGAGTFTSTGVTLTANQWARVAYVRVGTGNRFYINGTLVEINGLSFSGVTFAEMQIGNDGFSDSGLEVAYFREWNTFLTLDELNEEWFSTTPVQTSGLVTDTPLVSDLLDDSGNGNDWTAVGSLSFDATKPAFPSNAVRSAATAIASLPYTGTQDVYSEGLAYAVWFRYTATSADDVISVWGYGDNLTPYEVKPRVYVGAGTTDILLNTTNTAEYLNKPTRFAVTDGTDYFFRWLPEPQNPASATLKIEAESFTQDTAPIGSIVVNDDADATNYPMGFYSSTDGDDYHVLTYVKGIAVGEGGDVLESGEFLLSDVDAGNLKLYNGDTSLLTTVAIDLGSRRSIRTNHGEGVFYVGTGGNPCLVYKVDDSGTILQSWSMTGTSTIAAIAANNDGTILYSSGTSAQAIRRWDLVNDVALSNFLPTLAGYQAVDILVLDDDTIVISWQVLTGSSGDFVAKRYQADGTLLNTYSFGTQLTPGTLIRAPSRMAYAIDNPNSFWVYLHPTGGDAGTSVFRNVKVSDGSTLAEVAHVEFNQGLYSAVETLTPLAKFGNSLSCPFFISRTEVGPPAATGTIVVIKETIPSSDATTFDFTATGLSPTEFSLAHGESQVFPDLTPGDGYAVAETPHTFYQTTVEVSNGSPADNISVGAGETVTVTFTNSATFTPGFNTRPVKRRWLRRSPVYSKENTRVRYKMFQLDCLVGTGNANPPGDAPVVTMRYSDDGGHTWSYVMDRTMGARGKYGTQLQWWQLGIARNRVIEVYGSDPVKVALMDGFVKVEPPDEGID